MKEMCGLYYKVILFNDKKLAIALFLIILLKCILTFFLHK